ncbi:carboxylesterase/lipase family protein [Microbacterium sp. NIBRBAC000506063]|nr:carboxylesterase family protein [Microbacterium sp. NIBRBAC000506063]QTV79331.1 carboxylesterase/lipase family protein [Microbacterium sp. NIBRBAC000506063]
MAEIVVETPGGRYRGVRVDGVSSFLGMRYGVATGAEGRFRPASPAAAHAGVRDALYYGPAAIQRDARLDADPERSSATRLYFPRGGSTEGVPTSEECLTLDVWTPTTDSGARLPVMVWFHGGAFRSGSSAATIAAGDELARSGRVVVVTVNHRLGLLGFTALGHLLGPEYASSGAAGLTDMVLALEWVRDAIGAFGGDPGAVTVFGQSGGGAKVASLLRMPRAAGLFQRCIAQSPGNPPVDEASGRRQTDELLRILGIPPDETRRLLELPAEAFVEAQRSITGFGPSPVADGTEILAEGTPDSRTSPAAEISSWARRAMSGRSCLRGRPGSPISKREACLRHCAPSPRLSTIRRPPSRRADPASPGSRRHCASPASSPNGPSASSPSASPAATQGRVASSATRSSTRPTPSPVRSARRTASMCPVSSAQCDGRRCSGTGRSDGTCSATSWRHGWPSRRAANR